MTAARDIGGAAEGLPAQPEQRPNDPGAAERRRRSRQLRACGYRVLKPGFPLDEESFRVLIHSGFFQIADFASDRDMLDAISHLLDRLASLDDHAREAIRVLLAGSVTV